MFFILLIHPILPMFSSHAMLLPEDSSKKLVNQAHSHRKAHIAPFYSQK
jgi:hypothetical protein